MFFTSCKALCLSSLFDLLEYVVLSGEAPQQITARKIMSNRK